MRVCERLRRYILEELTPLLQESRKIFERESEADRVEAIDELLATFEEIVSDVEGEAMDEWECGELYDEFRRYREQGDLLSLA